MRQSIFLQWILPLFAFIMLAIALFYALNRPAISQTETPLPAPISPFKNTLAGSGVVEPLTGMIRIGTTIQGIVGKIYVTTGQKINVNEPLLKLKDNEANAEVDLAKAQWETAKVALANTQSEDHSSHAVRLAEAKVDEAKLYLSLKEIQRQNFILKSPIDGTVLEINAHIGDSTLMFSWQNPLMILGKVETKLQLRVEFDETDALRFNPHAKAVAMLRGNATLSIPLRFVKIEPLVVPKKSLTGDGNELVDTRVLQVIYTFDNSNVNAHVGQQMDVFVDTTH